MLRPQFCDTCKIGGTLVAALRTLAHFFLWRGLPRSLVTLVSLFLPVLSPPNPTGDAVGAALAESNFPTHYLHTLWKGAVGKRYVLRNAP